MTCGSRRQYAELRRIHVLVDSQDKINATGDGSFVTSFASSIAGNQWHVSGTGDFNGDGRDDIVWRNDSGQLNIWQATGDGSFVTSYSSSIAGNQWHVASIGDFNGDGRSDIAWRNDSGQLNIWQATSDNSFVTAFSTLVSNQWHVQDPFL